MCDALPLSTTVGTVFLLTAYYRLGYILYVTYLQQAVSMLNKSNFTVVCSHNTDLWLLQYGYNEKCPSHAARRFLSKHGRLQTNYVTWSCVNIALLSVVIIRFTNKISFFPPGATQPIVGVYFTTLYRALDSSRTRLLDRTQRRATVGRTPLNE